MRHWRAAGGVGGGGRGGARWRAGGGGGCGRELWPPLTVDGNWLQPQGRTRNSGIVISDREPHRPGRLFEALNCLLQSRDFQVGRRHILGQSQSREDFSLTENSVNLSYNRVVAPELPELAN